MAYLDPVPEPQITRRDFPFAPENSAKILFRGNEADRSFGCNNIIKKRSRNEPDLKPLSH
jgi:hypothetical protein